MTMTVSFFCKVSYQSLVDSDYPYFRLNQIRLVAASYFLPVKRYHRPQVSCLCLRCNDGFFVCKVSYHSLVDSDYPYFRLNQTRLVAASYDMVSGKNYRRPGVNKEHHNVSTLFSYDTLWILNVSVVH